MKIGVNDIVDCKIGSTQVNKVYLGSNLVWELGGGLDSDVVAFITANGITDATYISSLNTLVLYLKANSIYSKIQAWWIFYGNETQSKYNFINPVDTDAGHRNIFVGSTSDYVINNNGYQRTNNITYVNNNFIPSAIQNINSNGTTLVVGSNNASVSSDTVDSGAFNSGSQCSLLIIKNNNTTYDVLAGFNTTSSLAKRVGVNDSRGVFTGTKNSSTEHKLYINSSLIDTGTGGGTLPNVTEFMSAMNLGGSPYGTSQQRFQQKLKHEGLNATEVAILHSGLDTFENALGRKTW